jgi:DNA-binding LacI/PurR family transcriptional regulator
VIAVAITRLENSFHAEILQSLSSLLGQLGYRVLLFVTDPQTDGDPPIDEVLRHKVDAIILCAVRFTSHFAAECQSAGVPVILLNRIAETATASIVMGDNVRGGRTIAAFLLAGGHRNLAFLAGFADSSTSREREKGFTDAVAVADLAPPIRAIGNFDADQAARASRDLLSRIPRPDAIFCANDHMAIAAMDIARREFSIDVGRQVSIVGFDDSRPARLAGIDLTTYSQAAQTMAARAVTALQTLLSDPEIDPVQIIVRGDLIVRASAREPARGISAIDGVKIWSDDAP